MISRVLATFFAVGCTLTASLIHAQQSPQPRTASWKVLHAFTGVLNHDGQQPNTASPLVGPDGSVYGMTSQGGVATLVCGNGCGTVFKLTPPAAGQTQWTQKTLHVFKGVEGTAVFASLARDASGALYGTTYDGGLGFGTVFKLTPPAAGLTTWTKTIIHRFRSGADGAHPLGGVVIDASGKLYGTTMEGGRILRARNAA